MQMDVLTIKQITYCLPKARGKTFRVFLLQPVHINVNNYPKKVQFFVKYVQIECKTILSM